MECGATPYSTAAASAPYTNGTVSSTSSSAGVNAGGLSTSSNKGGTMTSERSPAKASLHVNFQEKGEVKERREKFLTAKYGSHQMSLIRKRLAVEMWLFEEVKKLYDSPTTNKFEEAEVEVDMDEILDMDTEEERRRHLEKLLIGAKKSQNEVKKFINDLLDKAETL